MAATNQLWALLEAHWPGAKEIFSDIAGPVSLAFLTRYPTPASAAHLGTIELVIAVLSGSVALLGDALHNLSDVSTSALVFVGFRASRKPPTERVPYGYERAEDLAGIGVAAVIWASAVVAGAESVAKLLRHGATHHVGWGIAAAVVGIAGNQLVARYKLVVGRRIQSAT